MFKYWLFLKRGLLTTLSYKTSLVLSLLGSFIGIIQFTLMGNFLAAGNTFPLIHQYGGNLLSYLVLGSSFSSFLGVSLNSFQSTIRNEQQMGTLENLLVTGVSLEKAVIYSASWNYIWTIINVGILLFIIIVFFNIQVSINYMSLVIILVLTILSVSGIGMMSAGIIMVTKQGDPINWVFGILTGLFSGVMFPVELLPSFFQHLSYLLPTTYALHGLRMALLRNSSPSDLASVIVLLLLFTIILFPSGIFVFKWGCNRAKRNGSLSQY